MATTQIVFLKRNKKNDGRVPVYIRITKNRQCSYVNTGILILEKQWNEKKQKVKPSVANAGRLNSVITRKIALADSLILEFEAKGKFYTAHQVKEAMADDNPNCFISYYNKWVQDRYQRGKLRYSTLLRYEAVINKLSEYVNGSLSFAQFDFDFLVKYESYLMRKRKNTQNTVNSNFNCLRKAMNDAVRNGKIRVEANPFFRYQFKQVSTTREFLSQNELREIENIESLPSELCYTARDIFILITQTGLRIGDVLMLRNSDYDGSRISFILGKTKIQTSILLTTKAKSIIEKYYSDHEAKGTNFLFPVINISPKERDDQVILRALKRATVKVNKCLKRSIIPRTNIKKHVSTHIGRHSLATNALLNGLSFEEIKSILKHKDIKVTQQYAKVIDQFADRAIKKLETHG